MRTLLVAVLLVGGCDRHLKMYLADPFDDARVEGTVVPITVDVRNYAGNVDIYVAPSFGSKQLVFTWPADDHIDLDIGPPLGMRQLDVNAVEQKTGLTAYVQMEIDLHAPGDPSMDYPARPAS